MTKIDSRTVWSRRFSGFFDHCFDWNTLHIDCCGSNKVLKQDKSENMEYGSIGTDPVFGGCIRGRLQIKELVWT